MLGRRERIPNDIGHTYVVGNYSMDREKTELLNSIDNHSHEDTAGTDVSPDSTNHYSINERAQKFNKHPHMA